MWCAADNHNLMCHIYAQGILDSNFTSAVIDKISNSHEIAQNFTFTKLVIFKVKLEKGRPTASTL